MPCCFHHSRLQSHQESQCSIHGRWGALYEPSLLIEAGTLAAIRPSVTGPKGRTSRVVVPDLDSMLSSLGSLTSAGPGSHLLELRQKKGKTERKGG